MTKRTNIPRRLEKAIYQQFDSKCAICSESEISTLEIHHIEPYAAVKRHEEKNLILVCGNCHSRIEAGQIPTAEVIRRKNGVMPVKLSPSAVPTNVISMTGSSNTGIIANQIVIKGKGHGKVEIAAPPGTIGSHRDQRNYLKYLIDRYHEFKKADVGRTKMNYAIFYRAIMREFGAKWDHITVDRFSEIVSFVQSRIDHTILGKTQKARGTRNYSTFDEYMTKHGA